MATEFVTTKDNHDSITLSVNAHGMKAATTISLNGSIVKTIDDSFDQFLGTNQGLKGNIITIATLVFRFPATTVNSTVEYKISGAADVGPDNPAISIENFNDGTAQVAHFMAYYF